MIIKLVGTAVVMVASVAAGLYYSGLESFRMQDLQEFKKALLILSSEIEYMSAPLPEAMANIARRTSPPVNAIFGDFAAALSENNGETAYRIWEASVARHKNRSFLAAEDYEAIASFGKTLGYLDKQMQLNSIRFTLDYIDGKVIALQSQCDKNKRMYRSLGLIGGILLAVVLW